VRHRPVDRRYGDILRHPAPAEHVTVVSGTL
jgi:hypothetical protein